MIDRLVAVRFLGSPDAEGRREVLIAWEQDGRARTQRFIGNAWTVIRRLRKDGCRVVTVRRYGEIAAKRVIAALDERRTG